MAAISSGRVMTVAGPVAPEELGAVLMHEHCYCDIWATEEGPTPPERVSLLHQYAVPSLRRLHSHGCHALVDATPMPMRAEPSVYRGLAERAGLNIIMSTGFYREGSEHEAWEYEGSPARRHRWLDPRVAEWQVDELAELMVREFVEGIGGTGVRPGIIKLASSRSRFTPLEEKAFRAAAKAQRETGLCITTHVEPALRPLSSPEAQLSLLEDAGADPTRVILGHTHRHIVEVPAEVRRCMDRGATFMPTNLRMDEAWDFWRRLSEEISRLFDEGYGDRIVLGLDWAFENEKGAFVGCSFMPPPPFVYMFTHALPGLKALGLREDAIEPMLVRNPARLLPVRRT